MSSDRPRTTRAAYTFREGEGLLVWTGRGAAMSASELIERHGWELRVVQFAPFPLAAVTGPDGGFRQALFQGSAFSVGPARVQCAEITPRGRRRVRLQVAAAPDVHLLPLPRADGDADADDTDRG